MVEIEFKMGIFRAYP